MKKIVYSICLAALAIGCSKTEVQYEQTDMISFAPVAQVTTKAAIEGTNFNTTQPLYVFANAATQIVEKDAQDKDVVTGLLTDNDGDVIYEPYLDNAPFTRSEATAPYTGAYYWPNVKALLFAGYVNGNDANVSVDAPVETMTVADYTQPDKDNNDLMYFFNTGDNGYGFTKTSDNIPVVMKHACAWLDFKFYGDAVTGAEGDKAWKLLDVQVMNISKTGTATLRSNSVEWAETDKTKEYVVYQDDAGQALSYDETNPTAFNPSAGNCIVIPQVPTELYIKYSYEAQAGTTIVEETTVPLTFNGDAEWAAGTKYTYEVTVTATAIKIMPSSADWTPYESNIPGTI